MTLTLNPYINLVAQARDALAHYQGIFGGEVNMSTFAEGGAPVDPSEAELIMHGQLDTPDGFTLMVSDVPSGMPHTTGTSISVSLSGDDGEKLRRFWDGLLEGGTVTVPLETAPWGDAFGMLKDRFGVDWLVNISDPVGAPELGGHD